MNVKQIEFFQAIFEYCYQGYSRTETGGAVTTPWKRDVTAGHVGGIIASIQFALMKPKMDDNTCEDLELCLRGPVLCAGYFNKGNSVPRLGNDGISKNWRYSSSE